MVQQPPQRFPLTKLIAAACLVGGLILFASSLFERPYPMMPTTAARTVEQATLLNVYPHDPAAYTQGLYYHQGGFFESTGLYGASSIRRTRLDGEILQNRTLSDDYFAEGITLWGDQLIQLTVIPS